MLYRRSVLLLRTPASRSLPPRAAWAILPALLVCLAATTDLTHQAHAQARSHVVAFSGEQAPGTNGASFSFDQPLMPLGISNTGTLVFLATLQGGDTQPGLNDQGLWIQDENPLRRLARRGDPVPELPGFSISSFGDAFSLAQQFFLDLNGTVAFVAEVSDGTATQEALFVEENKVLVVKIAQGMAVQGGLELSSVDLDVLAYNQGRVLLVGRLAGAGVNNGNDVALLRYDPGVDPNTLTILVREGDPMADVSGGFVYDGSGFAFNRSNPLGAGGDTILRMEGVEPVLRDRIRVLYRWSGGQLTALDSSDGTQPVFAEARLNSSQQAVFHGLVALPSTSGLWHEGQKASPVATEGDIADGPEGLAFEAFNAFGLFDDGRLVTQAQLTNNAQGIWMQDETGVLLSVAQVGSPAPGVGEGMVFFRVNNIAMNPGGQVAFSDLAFNPSTFEETSGLWRGDLSGLSLVIARGASVAVAAGDTRTVEDAFLGLGGNLVGGARTGADGHPTELNGLGELFFGVQFMNNGGYAVLVAGSGLVVNSTGDAPDASDENGDDIIAGGEESDGVCDTGNMIVQDDGSEEAECTLRAAITEANARPGSDQITYNIPGDGPHTIQPETPLPEITDVLNLIAPPIERGVVSKRGMARQGETVILDGNARPNLRSGLQFGGRSIGSVLENHVIVNFPEAGVLIGKDNVRISGCDIGFNSMLGEAAGNGGDGIQIQGGKGVVIGGAADFSTEPKGNIIAFNRRGVFICDNDPNNQCSGSEATILGNRIVDNRGQGVYVFNAAGNTIGGTTVKDANTIARNDSSGIRIEGPKATGNKIQGNLIGIDPASAEPSLNYGGGIYIKGASGTIIGGQTNQPGTAPGNVISGHIGDFALFPFSGIFIQQASDVTIRGNAIGTDAFGVTFVPNDDGIFGTSSRDLKIGGPSTLDRNLISGNVIGINLFHCESARIEGNWFGLDQNGRRVLSNGTSIYITAGSKHEVGGRFVTRPGLSPGNVFAGSDIARAIVFSGVKDSFIRGNLFGADPSGETLLDESSMEISLKTAIELDGASNTQVGGGLGEGNNFVNALIGLVIKNRSASNTVKGNRFGQTLSMKPAKMDWGILIVEGSDNTIGGSGFSDRNFITNAQQGGIVLGRTDRNKIINNVLTRNAIGIGLSNATGDLILNNRFLENTTGIKGDRSKVTIKNSEVNASSGANTGLSFSASTVTISGNSITDDVGDAIHLSDGSQATVIQNNIANNAGFGLNNTTPTVMVHAPSNWWGDPSGPEGAGPGSGDAVSPGVDFDNWRSDPVSLVTTLAADSLYLVPGQTDTVQAFVRNWVFPTETVEVSLSDDNGWLSNPGTQIVTLDEAFGAGLDIPISVPAATPVETTARLVLTATSQTDPAVEVVDSLLLALYEPTLASILVAPDTALLASGETEFFSASGADQQGNPFTLDPVWSATGGTIDATGLFVARDEAGTFAVTASDALGQISATAVVIIGSQPVATEQEADVPDHFALHASYPNPFTRSTTIPFDVKEPTRVVLAVFDVLGRKVATVVDRDYPAGHHRAAFDAGRLGSGVYVYAIRMGPFAKTRMMVLVK